MVNRNTCLNSNLFNIQKEELQRVQKILMVDRKKYLIKIHTTYKKNKL